ncbi:hypothetical protein [Hyphomicrobium sp. 99]|uniref:hypothetical protein n=1 Tax=Hyphomicrobium sp. 99 TaxID=1163419 RepID=UPI0005F78300|nr:hypothetical protein [Hyphomicrobium sp. 99]
MAHLPAKTALAAAILAALLAGPSMADPTGQKFEYGPYGSQNNSGSEQAAPQGEPPAPTYNGSNSAGVAAPSYRDDARDYSGSGAEDLDDDADGPPGDADGPPPENGQEPPPRAAAGPPPPPGDFEGGMPRVEVRTSAPDSDVPYEIREHHARQAAIEAWRRKVADRFGREFAHWRQAADKHVDCRPDRREGLVCVASALPVRGFDRHGEWRREDRY